jgi:hypothetical protein
LKTVVRFYNTPDLLPKTPDLLPKCPSPDSAGVSKTCWPPPEVPEKVDQRIGNLGLSDEEEHEPVVMKTLTDGYFPVSQTQ